VALQLLHRVFLFQVRLLVPQPPSITACRHHPFHLTLNLKLLYLTLTPLRLPLDQQVGHQTLIIAMHTLLVTRRLVILAMLLRRFHLQLDQGTIRILLLVVVCVPFPELFLSVS
jgi:hypothetical protein